MLFGNKEKFGIQIELDAQYGGAWLYGRICYWINNKMIGDWDMGTSLRDVLFQMKFASNTPIKRHGDNLCTLSNKDCFLYLDNGLYGSVKNENVSEELWKFDVSIHVDVFDSWKVYLLDCCDKSKVLYKNINTEEFSSFELELNYFNDVAAEAFKYLNTLYENEIC